jgi:hypothetical protein
MKLTEADKKFCINHCKQWAEKYKANQYLQIVLDKLNSDDAFFKEAWESAWPIIFKRHTNWRP